MAPKFYTLQKHVGHRKAIVLNLGVAIGDWYYYNDATHYNNERAFIGWNFETIMTLVHWGIHFGARKKFMKFVIVLHLFMHGRPMLEYEFLQELFFVVEGQKHSIKALVW